ncbi:MAG: cytochrome c oxidase assembly protein [Gemmatimonadota bacterium]|nr:cytochrome c oxidase assembly protein [Gemmatimonadota bacterium]
MRWWCSAQAGAWDWTWQAYPGVWLFVGLMAGGYVWLGRSPVGRGSRRHTASFLSGLALLWVALDWPVGALGAGYLASVHMLQYLLIALLAPALLLLGVPAAAYARLDGSPVARPLRLVTHPLVALAMFSFVLYYTHIPGVVDEWMASQVGSFGIDMLWLVAGLVFWWPVVVPVPERPRFPPGLKMGYLFLATVLNTIPYAFLTFGELPFYGIYELAPPVSGISTRQDQQIAGLLMKMGGGVILWTAITILFFRWFQREEVA